MKKLKRFFLKILYVLIFLLSLFLTYIFSSALIKFVRKLLFEDHKIEFFDKHYKFALVLWQTICACITVIILVLMWYIASFLVRKIYLSQNNKTLQ